jgi:hypothetical protein
MPEPEAAMNWLWSIIIITAGTAVALGIYREQCERDETSDHYARNLELETQLREAHAAEYITDTIRRYHLRENRAEHRALWDEQLALASGFRNGDFADWYVMRLWYRNREHWGFIVAAKGRITPNKMSA